MSWFGNEAAPLKKRILCVLFAVLFVLSGAAAFAMPDAPEQRVFSKHENDCKMIALTFDDGPHPIYTPEILEYLAENHIHATFFMIGVNVERYPELVQRVLDEGHEIGNHTMDHPDLRRESADMLIRELREAEKLLVNLTGERPIYFRPPGGRCGQSVRDAAAAMDYDIILWTVDTRDWSQQTTVAQAVSAVLDHVESGAIILCHDSVSRSDGSVTLAAMREFIPALLEQGYRFVTVSELLECES